MSSHMPPQTISVKRKRTEAPVDAFRIDHEVKRQKSQNLDAGSAPEPDQQFFFRRLTKPGDDTQQSLAPPTPAVQRRFRLDPVSRIGAKRHFVEEQQSAKTDNVLLGGQVQLPVREAAPDSTPRQRKRPGAGSALHPTAKPASQRKPLVSAPSENDLRNLEALSQEVEKVDNLEIPLPSPSKHKPKPPAKRFAERHPEKAAALASQDGLATDGLATDGDAMDIDSEYVYDHYVREPVIPNAPAPTGTVGLLVISEEDADWWDNEEVSDREFDTDDEDENAEDYYANDYPEDEMSDDDEFDRNLYQSKYRHGSDDEEFNAADDDDDAVGSGEDDDDLHFKMTVPKAQRVGYWGMQGE
ncbi:hypothetical protein DDE83_005835 [Stemphylium lycopersici]|uniref:Transcription factor Iwr1 domain-containing protein n=1 Tax=Stemphylium lycopersici TaxID=183478 RepID=A0A364N0Q1_STELY|nr:hypothetical protein DDE83_005835 [Stemphylium lycopersici]